MSSTTKVARRRVRLGSLVTAVVALALAIVFFSIPSIVHLEGAPSGTPTINPGTGVTPTPGGPDETPSAVLCPAGYICTPVGSGTSGTFLGLPSDAINAISLSSGLLTLVGFFFAGGRFLLGLLHVGQPGHAAG
jgi:hypothetical protein